MIKFVRYVAVALLLSSVVLMAARMEKPAGEGNSISIPENAVNAKAETIANPVWKGRVHTAGLLWLNITNFGLIGNMGNSDFPFREHCSGKSALGGELPGASGIEYLYGGGMWLGGYLDSASTPDGGIYFQGPMCTTGYEGWANASISGAGSHPAMELWPTGYSAINGVNTSDATKAEIVETSNIKGQINCFYTPVYDSTANAHEQFTTWYSDKFTNNVFTAVDDFDYEAYGRTSHMPMGIEIKQTSYAWSSKFAQKFVIVDYTIYNTNATKSIYNFFLGMFLDNDIGKTASGSKMSIDDLGGFKQNAKVQDENTGLYRTVPINMCWVADNDGREPTCGTSSDITSIADCEPGPGSILDGATSIFSLRVLRNPNPKLRYSFNSYNVGTSSALVESTQDWGPSWKSGMHNTEFVPDPDTGVPTYNVGWWGRYDLTFNQKGYADGRPNDPWGHRIGQGGMTEGRPLGDYGRYMVMSNGEFDYDFDKLLNDNMAGPDENYEIPITANLDPSTVQSIYKQRHKFKPYTPADGTEIMRKELGNGADDKFVVSFGPLGNETIEKVATSNGPVSKTVWKFAAGDSIKLTLAYIVSENFHYWLQQDPRNPVLGDEENKVNWGDAFRNAVWADRLYDVPMYDTKVTKNGVTKSDGWFGEDVGNDALFASKKSTDGSLNCWWSNAAYPGADDGEGNMKLDSFTTVFVPHVPDNNPKVALGEDEFLWKGNTWYTTAGAGVPADKDTIGTTADFGAMYKQIVGYDGTGKPLYDDVRIGWNDSLLTHGDGVPDFSAPEAPPSPKIKVETEGTDVIVTWTTDQFGNLSLSPEKAVDKFSRKSDFEGYQIWLSDSKNINDYVEVFSIDRKNYTYENLSIPGKFLDVPFMDVNYASGVAPAVVNPNDSVPRYLIDVQAGDSLWSAPMKNNSPYTYLKKEFGNNKLLTADHTSPNLINYTARFIKEENNTKIYEYKAVLKNKLLGKKQYVAVTSSDYGDPKSLVEPLKSSPIVNAVPFVPGKISGTNKVYVVPNPYRADIDYEALGWERVADKWREVDRKIEFLNVPKHSIVRIYTLAGDLVKTLSHNGDANESSREGDYVAKWNLLNQNDQAVASGIYLFAVEDLDGGKDKFVGKFVIIK